jgi:hypothetical protein
MSWRVEAFLLLGRFGIRREVMGVVFWVDGRFGDLDGDSLTLELECAA